MSAGGTTDSKVSANADLGKLAPRFRAAVESGLAACTAAGLDAKVYEGFRSEELQALYYARGRSVIPPATPVTNAQSSLYSWHGYGLAVDVISQSKAWDMPEAWFGQVAEIFKQYGCAWGGDWKQRDLPHFQWGRCKPSPSDLAREIIAAQGATAVWQAVGADAGSPAPTAAGTVAAPSPTASVIDHVVATVPADIAALQLNDAARNAAIILRARFPQLVFTSGRRAIEDQARAMAGNVVKDRRFIVATYAASAICTACQQWVDANPQATSREQIASGILATFQRAAESDVMKFSKHLTGDAFDVQPVDQNADIIKAFIRRLPLIEKFLDHEGQLIRWHAQFYR
ncbi:MAG: hypothetical protein JWR16_3364 [Nevskia sp.]|nr:hypothetical protein [Nevskia sp.]